MSGVKKEKPRLKYAVELSRHIQGFGLYLTLAILCNLMFKLLPLATSLVTSYMVSSVLLGEASQVIRLLAACGVLVILLSLFFLPRCAGEPRHGLPHPHQAARPVLCQAG